jgi:hypothetical protein
MTSGSADAEAACLDVLEGALGGGEAPDLARWTPRVVDRALQELVKRHGARAAPLLRAIADRSRAKDTRKLARLAIYRLEQSGVSVPRPADRSPIGPVVKLEAERPVRAWMSGIDGTGSRAVWILFEGGLGGRLLLCSLILNDEAGILEAAGGAITRKRLDTELRALREHQKLPWVETEPARARALVEQALTLHARAGTEPPGDFSRWRRLFTPPSSQPASAPPSDTPAIVDSYLLDRSAELLDLPEFLGWFVDPASLHEDALALLQARESRLVIADHIKAEREAAIIDTVSDRHFSGEARRRWGNRLAEMALIFHATDREEPARLAECAAAALAEEERPARTIALVRGLVLRGLTMAAEVALGRVKLAEVSRAPVRPPRSSR